MQVARTILFVFHIPRSEMSPNESVILGEMNRAVFTA